MKNQRKQHESTIPPWVRRYTGDGNGPHEQLKRFSGFGERALNTFAYLVLSWLVISGGLFVIEFGCALAAVYFFGMGDMETPTNVLPYTFFLVSPILAVLTVGWWWYRRYQAIQWLFREFEEITGLPIRLFRSHPDVDVEGVLRASCALHGTEYREDHFHRLRDILAWFGLCDPQRRPRDLAKMEP